MEQMKEVKRTNVNGTISIIELISSAFFQQYDFITSNIYKYL
jgi:hypothetical protein